MDPRLQDARGRIKEAVGALTGNRNLKSAGASDQAAAKAARAVERAANSAKGAVSKGADSLKDAIDSATKKRRK